MMTNVSVHLVTMIKKNTHIRETEKRSEPLYKETHRLYVKRQTFHNKRQTDRHYTKEKMTGSMQNRLSTQTDILLHENDRLNANRQTFHTNRHFTTQE